MYLVKNIKQMEHLSWNLTAVSTCIDVYVYIYPIYMYIYIKFLTMQIRFLNFISQTYLLIIPEVISKVIWHLAFWSVDFRSPRKA